MKWKRMITIGTLVWLSIFVILVALFTIYLSLENHLDHLLDVLTTSYLQLPLVVYFIVSALMISMLCIFLIISSQNRQERITRQLLQAIQENDMQKFSRRLKSVANPDLKIAFREVFQQTRSLQANLVELNKSAENINGESKSEILQAERQRLARELHDSVSQQLFAAMMMLSAVTSLLQKPDQEVAIKKQIINIEQIVNEAQSEMRALLLHLRPTSLEGKSLKDGIIGLLNEFKTKIRIKISWDLDDVHLDKDVEDNLFRVVQELLANTLRHAHANSLQVYLKNQSGTVMLRFVDDGVGFNMNTLANAASYGLNNIKERVSAIGGKVTITSFPNQGTSVTLKIPITGDEND